MAEIFNLKRELKDGIVTYDKLDQQLKDLFYKHIDTLPLTLENGSYYNYNTMAKGTTSTLSSTLLNVSSGEEYLITLTNEIKSNVCGVMFFDSNDVMLSYVGTGVLNWVDEKIIVPSGAVKMGVSTKTANGMTIKKVWYSYEGSGGSEDASTFKTIKSITNKLLNGDTFNIKLLGDSITAGQAGTNYDVSAIEENKIGVISGTTYYRNVNGYCWANLLKKYLESKFDNCSVVNNGISGMTSNVVSTTTRLGQLISDNDNLVICMYGTNDRVNNTPEILYNNLKFCYDYCKAKNIDVIFMANIPASVNGDASKSWHMEDVSNTIKHLANDLNIECIDLFTLFNEYCETKDITIQSLLSDDLHPNDNGYKVMFKIITRALGISIPRADCTWFDYDTI